MMDHKDRIFIPHKRVRLPHHHFEAGNELRLTVIRLVVLFAVALAVVVLFRVR